jgi:hypothetical protein
MISINTVRLGEHLPLLDLLPTDAPIAWVRGGDGLVGWGVHAAPQLAALIDLKMREIGGINN